MSYYVEIAPLGEIIEVEQGQTILDAALRAGIYLQHACGHGLCSTCKVDVLEGEVEQGDASPFALMDIERQEGKCLTCCAIPLSDLVIEADVDEDPDAQSHSVQDYLAVVTKIENFSPRIKGVFLALEADGLEFQAGQYINLTIPRTNGIPRAFSIASPPSSRNLIELNIALIQDGEGTSYIHNNLKVGDELAFSGPYGRFYVRKSAPEPKLFLAGGSGLSSPKCMVLDLLEDNDRGPITLIHGVRNQEELYYEDLFLQMDREHANFTYVPTLSDEPIDSSWTGYRGYVHDVAQAYFDGKFEGYKAYMCGPPLMIDACITTLMRGRCFEKHLFVENFYTNESKSIKPKSPLFKGLG